MIIFLFVSALKDENNSCFYKNQIKLLPIKINRMSKRLEYFAHFVGMKNSMGIFVKIFTWLTEEFTEFTYCQ